MILAAMVGVLIALPLVAHGRRREPRLEKRMWAFGLVMAALIYVAFALVGDAGSTAVEIELAGLAGYGALALAGLRWPLLVGLGWLAHIAWDVALHWPPQDWVPFWYPGVCLGFDLLVGVALVVGARRMTRGERG